ncbi:DNA integrity scanning protein DisA [Bowdeniella nasicola]|uniref:DNA integrity scanning protein DisA n=1 Tax=Bowdeniella nasicola TaxID=208480 RepID=A0A1Q5Q2I6_9ACTO|nr:DNA integrity scanning diadenylate cyclase DisA [Bowdeniella nasicola]OKL53929.1 DNA integrity scanning protein DisA [Bowdeniella nasicola]
MVAHDLRSTLARVAPGTELRDGLERILRGRTGALIVLGDNETVGSICSGGFRLDAEFTATRLRELSKMDGGVVLDSQLETITRANVQLLPASDIPTTETGMRHRTADRVAKQTGFPVISVSQSMSIIAIYVEGTRHVLEDSDVIISRASQAIDTLERYRSRLDEVLSTLTSLELRGLVAVSDVATVMQRLEMVVRIWDEIESYVIELGIDGRLLKLQLDELVTGVLKDANLVLAEYSRVPPEQALEELSALSSVQLLEPQLVAATMGLGAEARGMDQTLQVRGLRLLSKIPRLPSAVVEGLAAHFGSIEELLEASTTDLQEVEGVGPQRARAIHDGLERLAELAMFARR